MNKGTALEDAVRGIESTILGASPSLKESTFIIESRKRVVVEGVTHEIDVYVEVPIANGYTSIFLFECKNRQSKASKNDVLILSAKVDALNAQAGFFVAKSYSRDAVAQARKDARIKLLTATEHNISEMPAPFDFHHVIRERDKATANIEFFLQVPTGCARTPVEKSTASLLIDGQVIAFDTFVNDWIDRVVEENIRMFPSGTLSEGSYERVTSDVVDFANGQAFLNDAELKGARLDVSFPIRVARPPIVSHFEVASRGRSVAFAPVTVGGGTIQMSLVFAEAPESVLVGARVQGSSPKV